MPLRIFYVSGALLFAIFALLQINDLDQYGNHDAWSWIVIYAVTAILNVLILQGLLPLSVSYVWVGFSAGGLLFRLQDDVGNFHFDRLNPETYWNERTAEMVQQSNECGGLLVVLLWTLVLVFLRSKQSQG